MACKNDQLNDIIWTEMLLDLIQTCIKIELVSDSDLHEYCVDHANRAVENRGKRIKTPHPLILKWRYQYLKINFEKIKTDMRTGKLPPVRPILPCLTSASKRPFSQLRRVSITDLKVDMSTEGSYVILRTLKNVIAFSGWATVVEDHLGNACGLLVYNYPSNELFRVGTILIVKEPHLTIVLSGDPYIRCDSPTDIIVLMQSHPLYHLAAEISWSNTLATDDTDPEIDGFGNDVSEKDYYLLGLNSCTDKNLTWKWLNLKLSDVCFKLGYFESAISAATDIIKNFPKERLAIMTIGKASYNLRKYKDAYKYFVEYCKLAPNDMQAKCMLNLTISRLNEEGGNVDIEWLTKLCKDTPLAESMCADYVGPIKIIEVPGKGRGVVLTKNVKKDSLLMVSKALASTLSFQSEPGLEVQVTNLGKLNELLISQLVEMLMKNPNTYGPIIYDLSTGENPRKEVPLFCDPETKQEPICDVNVLRNILNFNAFGIHKANLKDCNSQMSLDLGLFVYPSYINHSCIPNVSLEYFWDIMVIKAGLNLNEGHEIFISYIPNAFSYEDRTQRLTKFGFTCDCVRCQCRN